MKIAKPESRIQSEIRLALAPYALMFRTNAGEFYQGQRVYSQEFGQPVLINLKRIEGLPKGYPDLSGVRRSDGRAVFIECKSPTGRVSKDQEHFLNVMQEAHALCGVVRSIADAIKIIGDDLHV